MFDLEVAKRSIPLAFVSGIVLEHRGLPVSPALRERVTHTTDLAVLERWLRRAITASTVEEAFAP